MAARHVFAVAMGVVASGGSGCTCRSSTHTTDGKETKMTSTVEFAPSAIPLGRAVRMDDRRAVVWTITTDGAPHGMATKIEKRQQTKSVSSVCTIAARLPSSPRWN